MIGLAWNRFLLHMYSLERSCQVRMYSRGAIEDHKVSLQPAHWARSPERPLVTETPFALPSADLET